MKKRLFLNTSSAIIYQIIYIAYGFILPKLILNSYGSEVNGLVSSINQYLSIISLTEFGMTAIIQGSLYNPLVNGDNVGISRVMTSATLFFRKIAKIFLMYILVLCVCYPVIVKSSFGKVYIISLIIILSLNMFVEYVFGITSKQLLIADQRIYICQIIGIVTFAFNFISCIILIKLNVGIHLLKIVTALILMMNSVVCLVFVKIKYPLVNCHTMYSVEPIKQKWNGISQHLASFIFSSTDIIVLTLFSTLKEVSVYSIYNMVLNGLKQLIGVFDNSIRPLLGKAWITDKDNMYNYFNYYEIFINTITILMFGCASCLIVPFVKIYTQGVNDIQYVRYIFPMIFCIAFIWQNIKGPYHTLIQSVVMFKETQMIYIMTAVINILVSLILVLRLGIIGVAIGTLTAAVYQFIALFMFAHKNIFKNKIRNSLKIYIVDIFIFLIAYYCCHFIILDVRNILDWIEYAIYVFTIWGITTFVMVAIVYNKEMKLLYNLVKK